MGKARRESNKAFTVLVVWTNVWPENVTRRENITTGSVPKWRQQLFTSLSWKSSLRTFEWTRYAWWQHQVFRRVRRSVPRSALRQIFRSPAIMWLYRLLLCCGIWCQLREVLLTITVLCISFAGVEKFKFDFLTIFYIALHQKQTTV